jgi:hypothetical protein
MSDEAADSGAQVRAAGIVAALSLATDFGSAVPLEHGLHSTLFAMRLCDRLGVDTETPPHMRSSEEVCGQGRGRTADLTILS